MLKIFYNLALICLFLLALPKLLWDFLVHRKYRRSFAEKLGLRLPSVSLPPQGLRIWVHAVSMGETKAVVPLVKKLQQAYPQASILFSSTTETGQDEAKRSLPGLAGYFFLPLDFSWAMKRLQRYLKPDLLIIAEKEFWLNLVHAAPRVVLVNGKISERSFSRLKRVPFFSRKLFSAYSAVCLQSEFYVPLFEKLGTDSNKIKITGNLKLDQPIPKIEVGEWKQKLNILPADRVVTTGSTHAPEEEMLLDALSSFPTLKILLVPRHPERFNAVAELLEKKGISYFRYSTQTAQGENPRVTLVDAMGVLNPCYKLSELAIVAGSFIPNIGGHNIFEPVAMGTPVLFGPYMHDQRELVEIILSSKAGRQVTLEELPSFISSFLREPPKEILQAGEALRTQVQGATERALGAIEKLLDKVV
jgi:3-deoxy-D-manno-octulosonic-acid transferase